MSQPPDELQSIRDRIAANRGSLPNLEKLSTSELVSLTQAENAGDSYAAEIARRQVEATGKLEKALRDTSAQLVRLNVLLLVFTVALFVLAGITYAFR